MHLATRPPLRRILAIDRSVRSGTFPNCTVLARQLEVTSRTVHRDMVFMRDSLGAPLKFCRRSNGYYYHDASWHLPFFQLTEGEMVALFIAERALRQYRGTPYEADLTRAFNKIVATLPEEITLDLGMLDQSHSFRASTETPTDVKTFADLSTAVLQRRQLRLTYWTASRDAVTERTVDPYHLANIDTQWYLIGYCHLRAEVRTFSPQRIRQLAETGETFVPRSDFAVSQFLRGAFRVFAKGGQATHQVRLRFAPEAARYVREKTWHASQQLVEQPDGGLLLSLKVDCLLEVSRWVLSFGAQCQVLEPAELRELVSSEAARMSALYATQQASQRPLAPSRERRRPAERKETG